MLKNAPLSRAQRRSLAPVTLLFILLIALAAGCSTGVSRQSPHIRVEKKSVDQSLTEAVTKDHSDPTTFIDVRLLAINDLHGHLEGPSGTLTVDGQKVPTGGAQYLATYLANARKKNTLIVAAGDMVGASPLISSLFHDEPTIEALNVLKLDATAVGNHEFDEGVDELLRLKNGGCHPEDGCVAKTSYKGADFDYLAANVVKDGADKPILPPYVIKEVGGEKVGLIGLTLEGTPEIISPKYSEGYNFLNEAETINRYTEELKSKGVKAIVVLIHEGGRPVVDDINTCEGISGPILDIVKKLDEEVDVVVSGHTHQAYVCDIAGKLVTSAKSYGRVFTEIDLKIDPRTHDIVSKSAKNVAVKTEGTTTDKNIDAIIAQYQGDVVKIADRVVGKIDADITREEDANGESALGRLLADAQLDAMKGEKAEIAVMNRGGVRDDLLVTPKERERRKKGEVTFGQVYAVQPFGNALVAFDLTGQDIIDLLEEEAKSPKRLFFSKGFTYKRRVEPVDSHYVDVASIKLKGKPIDPKKTYRLVANAFLADGGDGFSIFKKGTNRVVGPLDVDAFADYFEKTKRVKASKDVRVQVVK